MTELKNLKPQKVFEYFEKISKIPHGSTNMQQISDFCLDFAKEHNLKAKRDLAENVIIYKDGTSGYENSEPVILQGHLDMVCQKTDDCNIDFEKDGLDLYVDGDFLKARGTTLGADNGIAVAIILAILESDDIPHPPIEALFTTDEEIGMCGAAHVDGEHFRAKKLINLDSENEDVLTVSCAGGGSFKAYLSAEPKKANGYPVTVKIFGLRGGHSGVDINKGRENANMLMGRFLNSVPVSLYEIVSIRGGDKDNVITPSCTLEVVAKQPDVFCKEAESELNIIKKEISAREPGFDFCIEVSDTPCEKDVLSIKEKAIFVLACTPGGVLKMSAEIENLVETSLNMGIVNIENGSLNITISLRSSKMSALDYLKKQLETLYKSINCDISIHGSYPAWEFKNNSVLQQKYKEVYRNIYKKEPVVEAIHAGLECGLLSARLKDLDCISIGPEMYDVHTVNERLSISSTERFYGLVCKLLENLK